MNENCLFCKIVTGKIPSFKIYENNNCIVILDKFPATKGQSLVISKEHEDYILNIEDKKYSDLFIVAKKVAKAIDSALETERTCFVVEGFQVPHVHIRLHPAYEKRLLLQGKEASDEELQVIFDKIKEKI